MKILINNEEVLCDKNITISEEMLNTSSVILNNVYPKSWEQDKDYVSRFYFPKDYSKCKIMDDEDNLLFCGVVKNTGNISLNPRDPHFCNLQVLDFKDFLSIGETLEFVIDNKTILEAIQMVVDSVSEYGVILGNINLLDDTQIINAYSTLNKTAYDVFQYIADITQSRWTTRMIDDDTIAVDFYDPTLMPTGTSISYTSTWFENNKIIDMSFSYSTKDYRNKQIMLSDKVFADIDYTELLYADGETTKYNTSTAIGKIVSLYVDDVEKSFATTSEKEIGITADFYYSVDSTEFESDEVLESGSEILITYTPIVYGRQVITNGSEIDRIEGLIDRKSEISRYESRNDVISSGELYKVGQSYIKYKGLAEITLKVQSYKNIWNIGEVVSFTSPITELNQTYMVKSKETQYIATIDTIFYTYELSSSYNSETEINYFDNQRAKSTGNISSGEFILRNYDITNESNIIFDNLTITELAVVGDNILNSTLESPLNN